MGNWVHRLSDIDREARTAVCAECGPVKLDNMGGGRLRCATGRAQQAHRQKPRWGEKIEPHGMTPTAARLWREGRTCEMCGSTERLHVDHDHAAGKLRGVLCHNHNVGLGHFHDSVEELEAALAYLKKYA